MKQTKVKIGLQDVELMRERIRQRQQTLSTDQLRFMNASERSANIEVDSPTFPTKKS